MKKKSASFTDTLAKQEQRNTKKKKQAKVTNLTTFANFKAKQFLFVGIVNAILEKTKKFTSQT